MSAEAKKLSLNIYPETILTETSDRQKLIERVAFPVLSCLAASFIATLTKFSRSAIIALRNIPR
jgi:hypothetical protein